LFKVIYRKLSYKINEVISIAEFTLALAILSHTVYATLGLD